MNLNKLLFFILIFSFFSEAKQAPKSTTQKNAPVIDSKLEYTYIPKNRYIAGAVVGSVLGFGSGHLIQQRYLKTGWIFTIGQLASFFVFSIGITAVPVGLLETTLTLGTSTKIINRSDNWINAGAIGLILFKAWEIVDIIRLPSSHKISEKSARANNQRFSIEPALYTQNGRNDFGLSLSWKF